MKSLTEIVLKSLAIGAIFHPLYSGLTSVFHNNSFLETATRLDTLVFTAGAVTGTAIFELVKKYAKKKVQREEEGAFYKDYFLGHLDAWESHYKSLAASSNTEQKVGCDS